MNIVHAQRRWSWAWRPKEGTNLCRTSLQPPFRFYAIVMIKGHHLQFLKSKLSESFLSLLINDVTVY